MYTSVSAHGWSSNSAKEATSIIRFRRNDLHFRRINISLVYEDHMIDDQPAAVTGIQEKVVVRGQVVILECLERDSRTKFKAKIKDTHSDAAVRWLHDDKEVRISSTLICPVT